MADKNRDDGKITMPDLLGKLLGNDNPGESKTPHLDALVEGKAVGRFSETNPDFYKQARKQLKDSGLK